jgi:hypothetical protein
VLKVSLHVEAVDRPMENFNGTEKVIDTDAYGSNRRTMNQLHDPPHRREDEAECDTHVTTMMIPPPAPTKSRLRRRRMLFEKLRTKRQQILLQHSKTNSNNDAVVGEGSSKKRSLVTQFYRVDTVPRTLPCKDGDSSHSAMDVKNDDIHQSLSTSNTSLLTGNGSIPDGGALGINQIDTSKRQHAKTPFLSNKKQVHKKSHTNEKVVNVVLPGVPSYEEDWARDTHDYFNLIVLVPVTVLNIMNWNWDVLLTELSYGGQTYKNHTGSRGNNNSIGYVSYYEHLLHTVQSAWTGDWFDIFFYFTAAYFILDLLWIIVLPICVKSPSVIIQHHIAVLLYILIPYLHPNVRYCMGACMTVEINTWFLIARRVFNKQGFPPWTLIELNSWLSIRVKVISIFFYLTWISIRCILYPALLVPFYQHWRSYSKVTGTSFNLLLFAVLLHTAFCLLNLKWSYELLMSKLRYFRRQRLLYKQQQLRHGNRNSNGKLYRYQPINTSDPSISQGL